MDTYEVNYTFLCPDTGFTKRGVWIGVANGKGKHKLIERKFRKLFPKAHIINIKYQ